MSKVFIMWIQMKEKAPFRVVEMGAGPYSASGMMDFIQDPIIFFCQVAFSCMVYSDKNKKTHQRRLFSEIDRVYVCVVSHIWMEMVICGQTKAYQPQKFGVDHVIHICFCPRQI